MPAKIAHHQHIVKVARDWAKTTGYNVSPFSAICIVAPGSLLRYLISDTFKDPCKLTWEFVESLAEHLDCDTAITLQETPLQMLKEVWGDFNRWLHTDNWASKADKLAGACCLIIAGVSIAVWLFA